MKTPRDAKNLSVGVEFLIRVGCNKGGIGLVSDPRRADGDPSVRVMDFLKIEHPMDV